MEQKFSTDVAVELFQSKSALRSSLNIREAEVEYLHSTAAGLRSNPQCTDDDTSYKPRGARAVPSFGPAKVLDTISYSKVVKADNIPSQTDNRIKQLEDELAQMKTTSTHTSIQNSKSVQEQAAEIAKGELKAVYDLIEKNKKATNTKIRTVVQQVKDSDLRNKKRIKKSSTSPTKLMICLHRKTLKEMKSSSSVKKRWHGGSQ